MFTGIIEELGKILEINSKEITIECVKVLEDANVIEDKVFAASALIQGAFAEKKFDEAKKYIEISITDDIISKIKVK